jgi:hypothetical protein
MSGGQVMVVAIIAIVMLAMVLKARYQARQSAPADPAEGSEALRLREEVSELKERIKVLERITVEKENSLARQIEELRDR